MCVCTYLYSVCVCVCVHAYVELGVILFIPFHNLKTDFMYFGQKRHGRGCVLSLAISVICHVDWTKKQLCWL